MIKETELFTKFLGSIYKIEPTREFLGSIYKIEPTRRGSIYKIEPTRIEPTRSSIYKIEPTREIEPTRDFMNNLKKKLEYKKTRKRKEPHKDRT